MPQLDVETFFYYFILLLSVYFLIHSDFNLFENFIRIRARQILYQFFNIKSLMLKVETF
mgnify:CR=1 FL=1